MAKPPIIFLAFANDHQDYLYKLTEEQNAIRKALAQMRKEGLCEVVYETDTDLDKIWHTFNEYQDRIAIFHYGGHADDYSLLLQNADGRQQLVDGEGLVSFLSRQKGLQLVFLNGCSSKRQAEELRDKGIPAVVGTAEPINDEAATTLSKTFYEGLAAGRSIEQAWLGASDRLRSDKVKKEKGYLRGINLKETDAQYTLNFPWELYICSGAENVKEWNIPAAARNPLFGLVLPKEAFLRLPDAPFVGLHYFREDDAPIFFGRGAQIRELYNHLQGVYPIILLYGESGVGKSSMLDAGLLPRIKDEYQTVYARRIQEEGLLGTLDLALQALLRDGPSEEPASAQTSKDQRKELLEHLQLAAAKAQNEAFRQRIEALLEELTKDESREVIQLSGILNKWQRIEAQSGQPLLVILDQVEEKFTRPMPPTTQQPEDELLAFLLAIRPLFSTGDSGINGKLILSYRKEYHPEVRDAFRSLSLPYAELFLKRLDREGIMEAIEGVNREEHTRSKYRLEVEEQLPAIIADDLMEDPKSPIAPVLQIILRKLWITTAETASTGDLNQEKVRFTIADYQRLKNQGTTMGEFFLQQMAQLKQMEGQHDLVHSGLVFDLLSAHTTDMGTAGSKRREDLLERYELEASRIDSLLTSLEDLSLLNRIDAQTTILAHDTLAPVVIRAYNQSDAPGQRAGRILKNKISEVGLQLESAYLADLERAKVSGASAPELKMEHKGLEKYRAVLLGNLGTERWQRDQKDILEKHTRFNFGAGRNNIYLGEAELNIVEKGIGQKQAGSSGMRRLSSVETTLLLQGRQRRAQRQRRRRQLIGAGITAVAMVVVAMIFAFIQMSAAREQTRIAEARRLAGLAKTLAGEHCFTDALHLALAAYQKSENKPIETYQAFTAIFNESINDRLPIIVADLNQHTAQVSSAIFSPDGKNVLTASMDRTAKLWDLNGNLLADLQRHTAGISSAIFSPDGQRILTASMDSTAKLWNLQGNLLADVKGHAADVSSAIFSPDGQRILTASRDRTAKLWNLQGNLLADLKGHTDEVSSAVFSPEGQRILTASRDHTAKLWNLQGNLLADLKGHTDEVSSAVFSPDGQRILTASGDHTAKLWDIQGQALANIQGHTSGLSSAVFSPDGQRILTASGDNTAKLWDLQGQALANFQGHTDGLSSAVFSPDGQRILTASWDNTAKLWNLQGKLLADLNGHTTKWVDLQGQALINLQGFNIAGVSSAVFSPDGQQILTASRDHTAKLWTFQETLLANLREHTADVNSAIFSLDGQRILTASQDHTAKLWDLEGQLLADLKGHTAGVNSAIFSPDGQRILTASWDSTAKLWNLQGELLADLRGHTAGVSSAIFSPDGQQMLTASRDNTAKLWNLKGQHLADFKESSGDGFSIIFSPDGQRILTTSWNSNIFTNFFSERSDYTAKLWDLEGQLLAELKGHNADISSAVFSPDGQRILTASKAPDFSLGLPSPDSTAKLWNLQGKLLADLRGHTAGVYSAIFSPDGQRILTASADRTAKLWDIQGQLLATLQGHAAGVSSAIFSPDGQQMLTTSYDGTAKLWDLQGQLIATFQGHLQKISSAVFSPDGQQILTASADHIVKLWDLQGQILANLQIHTSKVFFESHAVFSPDGQRFLTTSYGDHTAKLWLTPALYESWVENMKLAPLSEEKRRIYGLDVEE